MASATSSNNHRASAPEQADSFAKRARLETVHVDSPADALLKEVGTSLDGITKGLMNLACQDTAGRGRFVALLSQVQAKINAHLGIKKMVRSFRLGVILQLGTTAFSSIEIFLVH